MNILFISAYVPSRIRVRSYSFIKALARRGHQITLVCGATTDDSAAIDELQQICHRVVAVEVSKSQMIANALRALPGELPFQAALSSGPPLLGAVQYEVMNHQYDVAHIEHLRAAALSAALQGLPTVLDAVDSISLLFERAFRHNPGFKSRAMALLDLARTRRYEANYTIRYDQVLVSSPEDAWALRELTRFADGEVALDTLHVVANGVDLDYFQPQSVERLPETLVFSGKMSYHANSAAALFLAQEIMPLVWAQRPDVKLTIAGSAPPREIQALSTDPRIAVTGYVADLRPHLAQATLAVTPLRYGVGIQNKVLEAMAMATPVVAARQVTQALQTQENCDLLLAQEAPEYAHAILALLDDTSLRLLLGRAGRRYVERYHNWDSAAAHLETLYTAAMGAPAHPVATPPAALPVDEKMLEVGSARPLVSAS